MTILRRSGGAVALVVACLLAGISPAGAETVTVTDPQGDSDGYDITLLRAKHKPDRLRVELRQSNVPDYYEVRVDVSGTQRRVDYTLVWSVFGQRFVYVNRGTSDNRVCRRRNAVVSRDNSVLTFRVPRSCLGRPDEVRLKAVSFDDQFGPTDRTAWTGRASVG